MKKTLAILFIAIITGCSSLKVHGADGTLLEVTFEVEKIIKEMFKEILQKTHTEKNSWGGGIINLKLRSTTRRICREELLKQIIEHWGTDAREVDEYSDEDFKKIAIKTLINIKRRLYDQKEEICNDIISSGCSIGIYQ